MLTCFYCNKEIEPGKDHRGSPYISINLNSVGYEYDCGNTPLMNFHIICLGTVVPQEYVVEMMAQLQLLANK